MWKPCLVCNALDLEMISIFRHPKNLNCILKILLELEAKQDDYLCRECCIEVINAFDLKRNLHQPELHSPEVLTDLVTIKNEVKEEILPSGSEEIIDSKIDYGLLVVDDVTTDLVCEDLPLDNKLELKALLGTGANARDTSEAQKSIEHAANDESDATSRKETVSSSNALEVNIEPKKEAQEDVDSSQSDSYGFQEYYKKEKSVDLDDNVESKPIGRTQDVVRAIKEDASTQKESANPLNDSEVMVKEEHVCHECGLIFEWKYHLAIHKRSHPRKKSFECHYCSKTFLKKTPFTIHLRMHTKPYKCTECGKGFSSAKGLKSHKSAHATERSFVCPHCSQTFNRSCVFREHILRTHPQKKPCICSECGKGFLNWRIRQAHIRTHHTAPHKPYICRECGGSFNELAQLKHHERTHIGQCPYKCVHCYYIFPTEPAYLNHLQTHAKGTFMCSHCQQCFDNKISLIVHYMHMHTTKRPYECPYCSKMFSCTTGIRRHLQVLHYKQTLT